MYTNTRRSDPQAPRKDHGAVAAFMYHRSPVQVPRGEALSAGGWGIHGFPLGVLFAQAYMSFIEGNVLQCEETRPNMYYRYVDDIFVDFDSHDKLEALRGKLTDESVLNFTVDFSVSQKLPFLDLMIDASSGEFITDVFRKPTDLGRCMNGEGDCTDSYKTGVIRAYIRRAIRNCSTWELLHRELQRVRQILVNNGYSRGGR